MWQISSYVVRSNRATDWQETTTQSATHKIYSLAIDLFIKKTNEYF